MKQTIENVKVTSFNTILLKPCPKCGGRADLHSNSVDYYRARCTVCGVYSAEYTETNTLEQIWNDEIQGIRLYRTESVNKPFAIAYRNKINVIESEELEEDPEVRLDKIIHKIHDYFKKRY